MARLLVRGGRLVQRSGRAVTVPEGGAGDCDCCGGDPPTGCTCPEDGTIDLAPCCCIPVGDPGSCRHEYATCWAPCDEDNVGCGGPGCSVCCGAAGCEDCGFVLPLAGWAAAYFWTTQINFGYPSLLPDPVCLENAIDSTGGGDLFQPFNFGRLCESNLGTWAGSEVSREAQPFGAPPEIIHRVTSGTWGVFGWVRTSSGTPTTADCIPGPTFVEGSCVEGSSPSCPGGPITLVDADASPFRQRSGNCLATTWDYSDPDGPPVAPCTEGGQSAGVLSVSREGCGVAVGAWSSPAYRLVEGVLVGVPQLEDPLAGLLESIPGERGRWAMRRFHDWRRSTPGIRAMNDRASGGRLPVIVRTLTARERARAFVDFGGRGPALRAGLGDHAERLLQRVGITGERFARAIGRGDAGGCNGCDRRRVWMNGIAGARATPKR